MDPVLAVVTNSTGQQARRHLGDDFSQKIRMRPNSFVATVDSRYVIAAGFWDNSFRYQGVFTINIVTTLGYILQVSLEFPCDLEIKRKILGLEQTFNFAGCF